LKPTVDVCNEKTRKNATAEAEQTVTVSLTADMWTSINMKACFAVTVHSLLDKLGLNTVL